MVDDPPADSVREPGNESKPQPDGLPGLAPGPGEPRPPALSPMRYPTAYTWLIFVSAMDLMMTYMVLVGWDGLEANPVARSVLDRMGFAGAVAFKFAIVLLVIIFCEVIGRKDDRGGRTLAYGAVIINAIPPAYSLILLLLHGPPAHLLE